MCYECGSGRVDNFVYTTGRVGSPTQRVGSGPEKSDPWSTLVLTRVRLAYQAAPDLGAFSRGTTDAFSVVRLVIFHVTGAVTEPSKPE